MNFLAPLFIAGAAAIALPILFHLIRRSSREKIVFSSLMFLEPSPPRITKRSRLEHILLLLFRAAVIALLALAFARPFMPGAMPPGPSQGEQTRVLILLDQSASMRREDLWNRARDRAAEILRSLKPDDAVAVCTFDQTLHTVLNFAESAQMANERANTAITRLSGISPSWAGTHLGNSVLNAVELLLEAGQDSATNQENRNLQLVVISDFQAGAKLEGLQGFEWPKKLQVRLEPIEAKEKFNASLQILEDSQRGLLSATNVALRVRLQNSPQARGEQFQVWWSGPAGLLGEKIQAYVPPGQSRILTLPPKPAAAEKLTLEGDAVELENTLFAAPPSVKPLVVAYAGTESPADPAAMRYYVERAFGQANLATRVLTISNSVPPEAAEAAMLVLADPSSSPAVGLARELLARGRTVLLPMRSAGDANAISEVLGGVLANATEAAPRNYALLGRIAFEDPLLAPFSDPRFSDFTKIHFWKHRTLNLASVTNATVLAAFDSGAPALAAIPVQRGRLLVLASTWKPSDSQLALSTKFVPLLFGMLEQSANLVSARHHFTVGETVPLPNSETNAVTQPDGKTINAAGRAFSQTGQPGLYRSGNYTFAVNMDPAESRFAPMAPEDLASLGVPVGKQGETDNPIAAQEKQRQLLATEAEARQKLWRWFIVGAVALLLIESWLAGRLSRAPATA